MSFLATLGWIILSIIIITTFIGIVCFLIHAVPLVIYAVASGIAHKNETETSAWDYSETHKSKSWSELSDEEKEKMVIANLIIADDVGIVITKEQLIKMLEDQLPITESQAGLSYKLYVEDAPIP